MANEVKEKFGASTAFTITLASLANAIAQQSTIVNNETTYFADLLIYVKITVGTTPTANTTIGVYLIRDDNNAGTDHRTDGAGTTDNVITITNAPLIGTIHVPAATSNIAYYTEALVHRPGPSFGIAVKNNTGVALNATAGNHWARYVGANFEIQ